MFAQSQLRLAPPLQLALGARFQRVTTATRPTPNLAGPDARATDQTIVAAANLVAELHPSVHLVASAGRAFRSPNLVERFYTGPAPRGRGFWISNTALLPETSVNLETGVKVRTSVASLEAHVFRNAVRNGIRVERTGNEVDGVPEYQNRNVERLRWVGAELAGSVFLGSFALGGSGSVLDATNLDAPGEPLGESYSRKVTGFVRYDAPDDRLRAEYRIRHNGDREDADLGVSPVGDVIPGFSVHSLGLRLRTLPGQWIGILADNLTNALYAEASNVGFFLPEPGRNLVVTVGVTF